MNGAMNEINTLSEPTGFVLKAIPYQKKKEQQLNLCPTFCDYISTGIYIHIHMNVYNK